MLQYSDAPRLSNARRQSLIDKLDFNVKTDELQSLYAQSHAWAPDGHLYVLFNDNNVRLFDPETGSDRRVIISPSSALAMALLSGNVVLAGA